MSISEWVLVFMPMIWIYTNLYFDRPISLKKVFFKFLILWTACFVIRIILAFDSGAMLGGRFEWKEVFYQAWLLMSFFSVLEISEILLNKFLAHVIRWPAREIGRKIIQKVICYSLLFTFMIPFFLAMTSIHRFKIVDAQTPKTAFGLEYKDVSLKTMDGLHIQGWFIPANSDRAVVIAHGLGANKSNFLGIADMWHELGVNVLIFDFRGHGMSGGHTVTFGYRERFDVMAATHYLLKDKKFTTDKIIGYGVSFGGAAMIHAANEMPVFHKLIIDSSFANLGDMADTIIDGQVIIPSFYRKFFKEIMVFFVRLDLGFDPLEKSPEKAIGEIRGTPILLIHGKGDPISWHQTERLYQRARDPKEVVFLNTQGHFETPNDPAYIDILRAFLAK